MLPSMNIKIPLPFLLILTTFFHFASSKPLTRRTTCNNGKEVSDERCCVWFDVLDQVQEELFDGGQCDEVAHDALRLSFHDAVGLRVQTVAKFDWYQIGWSSELEAAGKFPGGGADGSLMIWRGIELVYAGNAGLDEIVEAERIIAWNYNITWGDFIQFAGAVSVGNCAGGPRIAFWAGRPNATEWAPNDGLLPDAGDSVDKILTRMADAGFSSDELVALLASHSVGMQEEIDESIRFTPFDTTPEIFDSQFYLETLLTGTAYPGDGPHPGEALSPLPGEFRLQSDAAIARDSRTACEWQKLLYDEALMQSKFAAAMDKMAIVGHNREDLYDCSEVIPVPPARAAQLPVIPAGLTEDDIEFSCETITNSKAKVAATPTPTLTADSGPLTSVPPFSKGHDRLEAMAEFARAHET